MHKSSLPPSVTLRYRDHLGWNSSKITSLLIRPGCSLFVMAESETPIQTVLEKYSVKILSSRTCIRHQITCNPLVAAPRSAIWQQLFAPCCMGVLCSIEYRVSSIKTRVSGFNWISRKHRIRPLLILETRVLTLESRDSNFSNPRCMGVAAYGDPAAEKARSLRQISIGLYAE